MQLLKKSGSRRQAGYILLVLLIMLAVMLIVFASVLTWSSSHAILTRRNNLFNVTENAAESCTENILGTMMRDFTSSSLGSSNTYNTLIPATNGWPYSFAFSDTNGNSALSATVIINNSSVTNLSGTYAGLFGQVQQCQIASTASPVGQGDVLSATVGQTVQFAQIPLFQFGIFYNLDLEINPTTVMGIGGAVWCNGNIYNAPSGTLVYFQPVSVTGQVFNTRKHPQDSTADGTGQVIYSQAFMTNTGPVINRDTLIMPVGAGGNSSSNVNAILQLPPSGYAAPGSQAYTTVGQLYLYNEADLVISNSSSGTPATKGTNITVYYQNNNATTALYPVPADLPVSTYTNTGVVYTNYAYSFVTNATFYDYRESKTVDAIQVDVHALNTWLTNSSTRGGLTYDNENNTGSTTKNHHIWSIYAINSAANGTTMPGVRLVNGAQLPYNGLTVATPDPLYVMGDYNIETNYNAAVTNQSRAVPDATYTRPAALMCDAITVLSTNYHDSWTSSTPLSSRTPVTQHGDGDQTLNAAILTGIVPSANGFYSGGVENIIRFLENWPPYTTSGYNTFLNTGSQVGMFSSLFATNHWQAPGGNVYAQPGLDSGFDQNFSQFGLLPPLTPRFTAVVRAGWVMY